MCTSVRQSFGRARASAALTADCPRVLYVTNEAVLLRRVLPSGKVSLQHQTLSALAASGRIELEVFHIADGVLIDGALSELIELTGFTTIFVGVMPTRLGEVHDSFCKALQERAARCGADLLNACAPGPSDAAVTIVQDNWRQAKRTRGWARAWARARA